MFLKIIFLSLCACVLLTGAASGMSDVRSGPDFLKFFAKATLKQVNDAVKNVNAKDKNGWTPLLAAAIASPNPEVITALIKIGADINAGNDNGWTPLMAAACYNNSSEVVTALINNGADVTTSLIFAARNNPNPEAITALIKIGADINAENDNGWTPLMAAACYNNSLEVVTALINNGADVNAKNKYGVTPLMKADFSDLKLIKLLVEAGADLHAKDENGGTITDHVNVFAEDIDDYSTADEYSTVLDTEKVIEYLRSKGLLNLFIFDSGYIGGYGDVGGGEAGWPDPIYSEPQHGH